MLTITCKYVLKCIIRRNDLLIKRIDKCCSRNIFNNDLVFFPWNSLYNGWKNNMKADRMIICIICFLLYVFKLVNGMLLPERSTTHLNYLLQKLLQYQYHKENYIQSLNEGIIPNGLLWTRKTTFEPVSSDFTDK